MESNKQKATILKGVSQYAIDTYGFTSKDRSYLEKGKQHVVVTAKDGTRTHYRRVENGDYEIIKIEEGFGKKRVTTNYHRENISNQTEGKEKRTKTQVEVMGANNLNAFYEKESVSENDKLDIKVNTSKGVSKKKILRYDGRIEHNNQYAEMYPDRYYAEGQRYLKNKEVMTKLEEINNQEKNMENPKSQKKESKNKNVNSDESRILELENIMRSTENSDEKTYLAAESERKQLREKISERETKKAQKNLEKIQDKISKIQKKIDAIEGESADKHELLVKKAQLEQKRFAAESILNQENKNDARISEELDQDTPDQKIVDDLKNMNKGLEKVSEQLSDEDEQMAREIEGEISGQYRAHASVENLKTKNQSPMEAWIERNDESASNEFNKEGKVNTQEIFNEMKRLEDDATAKFQKMNKVIREVKELEGDNYDKEKEYPKIEAAKAEHKSATEAVAAFEAKHKDILDKGPEQKEILGNKTSEERKAYEQAFEAKQTAHAGVIENNNTGESYVHVDQGKLFNLRRKERLGTISDNEKTELENLNQVDAKSRARYNELRELDAAGELSPENKNWLNAIVAYRNAGAKSLKETRDAYMNPLESENETPNEDHLTPEEREKNEQIRSERAANPDRDKMYDESKKLESADTERSNKHLGILERRRKNAQTRESAINKLSKQKITQEEFNALVGPSFAAEFKIRISNLDTEQLGDFMKNEAIMQREKIGTLERRIGKTEKQISRYNNRNEGMFKKMGAHIGLARKQFGRWFENPQNKKKLVRRVIVTGLAATASGFVLPAIGLAGAGGAMAYAGGAASFAGGYAGGEGSRKLYNLWLRKNNKDYRQQMANERANRGNIEIGNEGTSAGTSFEDSDHLGDEGEGNENISKEWKDYKDRLSEMSTKIVKKQNKWRKTWDTVGRAVGALSSRAAFNSIFPKDIEIPETTPDVPVKPKPEIVESFISKDAYINKGEGVTHALKRQLENNPNIAEKLGYNGKTSDLARIAKDFGYISEDGSEVRVFMGKGAAYELTLDDSGNPIMKEYENGHIEGDHYVCEDFRERHIGGSIFEGNNIEDVNSTKGQYEYLHNGAKKVVDNTGFKIDPNNTLNVNNGIDNTGFNLDNAGTINTKIETSSTILRNTYPGHRMVVNNMFDAKFNNMHTDRSVMDLFSHNGVRFSQKNFEMLGWRMAPNGNGAAEFINENDVGLNKGKLYTWKDIYEQTDFRNMKTRYPNLDFLNPTNNGGGAGFNLDNAGTIDGTGVELKETFSQNTGHFKITHFNQGNPKITYDPNFRFKGDMNVDDFTGREERLLEKGKFSSMEGMPAQGRIPELGLNNAGIIKLKNGQYVFQNIVASPDSASGQGLGSRQIDTAMRMLGMPNHAEHVITDDKPIPGSNLYRTRVFTPITEDQAKYIGKIYTEMRRFTGMNNPK